MNGKNVAFLDVTFSVQKSITVLHAAFEAQEVKARAAGDEEAAGNWGAHKQAVEDAIWAGNNAGLDYLAEHAGYSRVGHHGGTAGRYIDAHGLTVASFFQHTSRTNDPQLHIHNGVLSRVQGTDGVWRTLDGRSLYIHRPGAAAVAERTMTEHVARSLRVLAPMRPDGKSREIAGIDQAVNDFFSTRSPGDHPEDRRARRRVRGQVRARAERAATGPAATPSHHGHPPAQVPRRRNPRTAPGAVGARTARRGRRSGSTRSPPTSSPWPARTRSPRRSTRTW